MSLSLASSVLACTDSAVLNGVEKPGSSFATGAVLVVDGLKTTSTQ